MTPIYDQLCAARGFDPLSTGSPTVIPGFSARPLPEIRASRLEVVDPARRAPRRFRIYRLPNQTASDGQTYALWPWVLRDRENPANLPRFAGMEEAVAGMDERLRAERATA